MALDIGALNIGFSEEGLAEYKTNLKTKVITDTEAIINDISEIENALNAGWQGVAKDKFVDEFAEARRQIVADLNREYEDLEARFAQLQNTYFEQDNTMMNS